MRSRCSKSVFQWSSSRMHIDVRKCGSTQDNYASFRTAQARHRKHTDRNCHNPPDVMGKWRPMPCKQQQVARNDSTGSLVTLVCIWMYVAARNCTTLGYLRGTFERRRRSPRMSSRRTNGLDANLAGLPHDFHGQKGKVPEASKSRSKAQGKNILTLLKLLGQLHLKRTASFFFLGGGGLFGLGTK